MLQQCCNSVATAVLQQCSNTVTTLLQQCYNSVKQCYNTVITALTTSRVTTLTPSVSAVSDTISGLIGFHKGFHFLMQRTWFDSGLLDDVICRIFAGKTLPNRCTFPYMWDIGGHQGPLVVNQIIRLHCIACSGERCRAIL